MFILNSGALIMMMLLTVVCCNLISLWRMIEFSIDLIVLYKRQLSPKRRSEDDIPATIKTLRGLKQRSPEEHLTILVQVVKMYHQQLLIRYVE